MNNNFSYVGSELELFSSAVSWKAYWASQISGYLGRTVIEVGAGIGATAEIFRDHQAEKWISIEPDNVFCGVIKEKISEGRISGVCEVVNGTIGHLPADEQAETVIYIDVLEHIQDDAAELVEAARHLSDAGYLIVVSPAYNFLYSEFDKSIGHFRRYNKKELKSIVPSGLRVVSLRYLDSVGFFASFANKMFLKNSMPKPSQIAFWDKCMVPISRRVDPILGYGFGKTILGVFKKC